MNFSFFTTTIIYICIFFEGPIISIFIAIEEAINEITESPLSKKLPNFVFVIEGLNLFVFFFLINIKSY